MVKKTTWLALAVSLGLALRLAYALLVPAQPVSDYLNYHLLAINMLKHGVFGFGHTPVTHLSPGTSLFLALIYAVAGSTDILYPKLVQVALGTLCIVLVYYVTLKVFDERAAILSAFIWAAFPVPVEYTTLLASENPFTFLSLLSLALLLSLNPKSKQYYAGIFFVGVTTGLSILVRPVALLLPLVILLFLIFRGHKVKKVDLKPIIAVTLILFIGVLLTVGPWCMRNYVEFGRFSTSSNAGVNLWMGNNQYATGTYMNMDSLINETFGDVSGLTDFERDKLYSQAGKDYILAHPVETLKLDIHKLDLLYGTCGSGVYWSIECNGVIADPALRETLMGLSGKMYSITNWYYYIVSILAVLGVLFFLFYPQKCDKAAAMLLILYVLYFSAAYAATTAFDRYNFNVLPVFAMFGGYGFIKAIELMKKTIGYKVSNPGIKLR